MFTNIFYRADKILQWLVDGSVPTPRAVLKQRAAYYEEEFKTLLELTSTEQRLLVSITARLNIFSSCLINPILLSSNVAIDY